MNSFMLMTVTTAAKVLRSKARLSMQRAAKGGVLWLVQLVIHCLGGARDGRNGG